MGTLPLWHGAAVHVSPSWSTDAKVYRGGVKTLADIVRLRKGRKKTNKRDQHCKHFITVSSPLQLSNVAEMVHEVSSACCVFSPLPRVAYAAGFWIRKCVRERVDRLSQGERSPSICFPNPGILHWPWPLTHLTDVVFFFFFQFFTQHHVRHILDTQREKSLTVAT